MHKFSLSVARIEMLRQDAEHSIIGAIGTAFSTDRRNEHFLITNWHNVTGVNPETGETLPQGPDPECAPAALQEVGRRYEKGRAEPVDRPLYEAKPTWFEHSGRRAVDVVALLPLIEPNDCANVYINEVEQATRLEASLAWTAVLGFQRVFSARPSPDLEARFDRRRPLPSTSVLDRLGNPPGHAGSPVIVRHSGIFGIGGGAVF